MGGTGSSSDGDNDDSCSSLGRGGGGGSGECRPGAVVSGCGRQTEAARGAASG